MLDQSLKNTLTYQKHQMVSIQLVQHHTGENILQLTPDISTEEVVQDLLLSLIHI